MNTRAILLRGLFSASGASHVAFTQLGIDNFSGRFDELHPEARAGWERCAGLLEQTQHLWADKTADSTVKREPLPIERLWTGQVINSPTAPLAHRGQVAVWAAPFSGQVVGFELWSDECHQGLGLSVGDQWASPLGKPVPFQKGQVLTFNRMATLFVEEVS